MLIYLVLIYLVLIYSMLIYLVLIYLVVGIEFQHIPGLSVLHTVPGTKLLISKVAVKRGVLLLFPENITFLGGGVEELIQKFDALRKSSVKRLISFPF
jgi:hypothetical protein